MVNFLYMNGDLNGDTFLNISELEGIKAHQYHQSKYGATDLKEVSISYATHIQDQSVMLIGRMDGLLNDGTLIEEIKSTKTPIDLLFEYNIMHYAQLKLYAYMYLKRINLIEIDTKLTYILLGNYEEKSFYFHFDILELETFFLESINAYMTWINIMSTYQMKKFESIMLLKFPFEQYRSGQRHFMTGIYNTLKEKNILYAIAPTGIGKTMASLYTAIKSLKEDNEKIFYLTAKNEGKKVVLESLLTLKSKALDIKALELTSKDTICFLEKRQCDPLICPFAKGFFDRLKDALIDIFTNEDLMTRKIIESYAQKHQVCPFEFSLAVSNYVDVIICDYNYVFDPRAHLTRYFDESNYKPILLVDEAHNLVSRSLDMYSTEIKKSSLVDLRKLARKIKPSLTSHINKIVHHMDNYNHEGDLAFDQPKDELLPLVRNLIAKLQKVLSSGAIPNKNAIMDHYFELLQFDRIYDFYGSNYKTNVTVKEDISIKIQCLNASLYLSQLMKEKSYGTILFSATLYPLNYFKTLITNNLGEHLIIKSPFDPNRLNVMKYALNTRYANRMDSIYPIIEIIKTILNEKKGNYIAFFPSYQYMHMVIDHMDFDEQVTIHIQKRETNTEERNMILDHMRFKRDKTQLAFFVLGGMFSEGIDYVGDMLNGIILIGVGMPSFSFEVEQLRAYYEDTFENGFDFAYTYPGMNKVIQAVGRVIRKDNDYGVAVLIDDRYNKPLYKGIMPSHWHLKSIYSKSDLQRNLRAFWAKYE